MDAYIYHGSNRIIEVPVYGAGKGNNDFGKGFYCTKEIELAKEWACKNGTDGFANKYAINMDGLNVLNLNSEEYNILNWLALLTKYRGYWQAKSIAEEAKNFLQNNYLIDISKADIIIGNRADDSYFSFAQDFVMGTISLQKLSAAMDLGNLGEQLVLKSEKAFAALSFIEYEISEAEEYYVKKVKRDASARSEYSYNKGSASGIDDIYMIDIFRGRVKNEDLRIQ